MKKNRHLLFTMLVAMGISLLGGRMSAYNPATPPMFPSIIELEVRIEDPRYEQENPHRNPVQIPDVSIFGHTLTFDTSCDGNILRLANEDGDIEYSTVIPSNTVTLELPSYLEGEYEIQIIRDNLCFYGYITLQ